MYSVLGKSMKEEGLWENQPVALSYMQTSSDHTWYDSSKYQGMGENTKAGKCQNTLERMESFMRDWESKEAKMLLFSGPGFTPMLLAGMQERGNRCICFFHDVTAPWKSNSFLPWQLRTIKGATHRSAVPPGTPGGFLRGSSPWRHPLPTLLRGWGELLTPKSLGAFLAVLPHVVGQSDGAEVRHGRLAWSNASGWDGGGRGVRGSHRPEFLVPRAGTQPSSHPCREVVMAFLSDKRFHSEKSKWWSSPF